MPTSIRNPVSEDSSPVDVTAAEAHRAALLRYAARLMGDAHRARDVVQDVMARFVACAGKAEPGREAEWLFTVCRRRAIDLLRKENRVDVVMPDQFDLQPAETGHPGDRLDTAEARALVRELVDELPANQQEVIRLKFQNGFSYKEIAGITGLSVGNVGFLIHTAVARLRKGVARKGMIWAAKTTMNRRR